MFDKLNKKHGLLLENRSDRAYFSKIDISEGYLLYCETPVYFTDSRYISMAKEKLKDSGIESVLFEGFKSIKSVIKSKKIKQLYIDYTHTTLSTYEKYREFGVKLLDGRQYIENKRKIKSADEIRSIEKSCEILSLAYKKVIKTVKVGITEKQLAKAFEEEILRLGGQGLSFETIVAFGKNSAVPHHETGDTMLEEGMPILVDFGAKYNGYCSDMTRMAYVGEPSKKFSQCYEAVLNANLLIEEKIVEGDSCIKADALCREYLKQFNLDKNFTHSLGHGIGLDIHESPYLSSRGKDLLQENMVFSIEPGVYFDGEFGIRIEDTVIMNNGKIERLFNDEKKLIII